MNKNDYISVRKSEAGKIDWWEVTEDYGFFYSTGDYLVIPKGFVTDFASVPRGLWSIIPPNGKTAPACIIHDYLYTERKGDRLRADLFFYYDLMQVVKPWQALVMYAAVRIWGKSWWDKD